MAQFCPKYGEFYKDLQSEVNQYFQENNLSKNGNWKNLAQYFGTISVLIISWFILFVLRPHLWFSIWFYPVMGICVGILCVLGHESVHNCFSRNSKFNNLVKNTLNVLGGNWQHYRFKHSLHHNYTNIVGLDDDINFWPLVRTSPTDEFYFWHRFQHLYTPFLYCFAAFFLIFDFGFLSDKKIAEFSPIRLTKRNITFFWLSKICHILIFFIIPGLSVGFGWVVGGYLLMMVFTGLYLTLLIQPSHVFKGTTFWQVENDKIETEWAKLIVQTTANYNPKNRLLSYFSGGMNCHLVHSLFPTISFVHYGKLNPIVLKICEKHQINYNEFQSVRTIIKSHFRHLYQMSYPPKFYQNQPTV